MSRQSDNDRVIFLSRAKPKLAFAWLPHRCNVDGDIIWLKKAYKLTAVWTGPGDPVVEVRWFELSCYTAFLLTHNLKG